MKRKSSWAWTSKIAEATALLMILSVFMAPMMAFAGAFFESATYDARTGTVTATVYTDEPVTESVYLDVYDQNNNLIRRVFVPGPAYDRTKTVNGDTYYYYDFNTSVTANTYGTIKLIASYGSVTSDVYTLTSPIDSGGGRRGGGGGSSTVSDKFQINANGNLDANRLKRALERYETVTLELRGTFVLIPASALDGDFDDRILRIVKDGVTLELPVSVIDVESLLETMDTTADRLFIRVGIEPASDDLLTEIEQAARNLGANIMTTPMDFDITAVGPDDQTIELNDFGNVYVTRTLPLEQVTGTDRLVGVVYDETAKTLRFVPTTFVKNEDGTIAGAALKRPGNSVYTVLSRSKTFSDIRGHWAQEEIEAMAGKLIIEGISPILFEPDRDITRAEFAALLVRALGLTLDNGAGGKFSDVSPNDWYASVVGAASEAGLIKGYPDGTFGPNRNITRAEMAAMMVRALDFVGQKPELTSGETAALLSKYTDRGELDWAEPEFAAAVKAGIIQGMTENTLAPRELATRAQAAVMLERMLRGVGFIE